MTQYTENRMSIHEFADKIRADIARFEEEHMEKNKDFPEIYPYYESEDTWYEEFNIWSMLEG